MIVMKLGGTLVGTTESNDSTAKTVVAAVERQAGGPDAEGGIAEAARGQAQGRHVREQRGGLRRPVPRAT